MRFARSYQVGPVRESPARRIGQTSFNKTEIVMGQPPRRPVTRGAVRGEIPTSARASAHVLPAALRRPSPLSLVSGGPAVWRGSCSGEGLHRLDGQRRCRILVMVGLGRRACHEATFRALPRGIPHAATRVGNRCTVSVVLARCTRRHAPSVALRQGVRVLATCNDLITSDALLDYITDFSLN